MITLLGKRELVEGAGGMLSFDLCLLHCLPWFGLGATGRICSVIVALPGHLLYYFSLRRNSLLPSAGPSSKHVLQLVT